MKKKTILLLLFTALIPLLAACGTVNSAYGGLTDEGFIKISSENSQLLESSVYVSINGNQSTTVTPLAQEEIASSRPHFILKPGTYSIVVTDSKGNVLYNSKVFLSTRKTKLIELH